MFFNELDILDIRLNILDPYVDKFVIVESTITHSGKSKELFFENNKNKFDKFKDKIIHVIKKDYDILETRNHMISIGVIHNESLNSNSWLIETENRNAILEGLKCCKDDDIILISDVDEIPDFSKIDKCDIKKDVIYDCEGLMFYYYFNVIMKNQKWVNSKILKYSTIVNNELRPTDVVRCSRNVKRIKIQNCGWHFSYIGDEIQIKKKLESFMHQEMINEKILEGISDNVKNLKDILFRGNVYDIADISVLPKYVVDNKVKYKKYIKE